MLTKKRHAGAQSGPPKKRLHVDKVKSNGSTEAGTLKKAVRKLPVTSSAANGDDSDEDGSDGGEGGESEENDEDLDESTPGKTGSQNITGKCMNIILSSGNFLTKSNSITRVSQNTESRSSGTSC